MNHHKRIPQDVDYKIKNAVVFLLGAAAIALMMWLVSCQKESSFTAPKGVIESDKHLVPPGGYRTEKREETTELLMASKKANPGKGKGKPTQPPTDTTGGGGDTTYNPPPQPTGNAVILMDFDGYDYAGGYWTGPRRFAYSGMNAQEIQTVLDSAQADFQEFGITVTTDEAVYYMAPANRRMRVVVTEDWQWYGQAGGVAYVGSFTWGNETPAFVFSSLLGYNAKNVWEAASHEAGHTLGLRHQADWVDGVKVSDYSQEGNTPGWAPIMGVGYYKPAEWKVGMNSYGNLQDDRAIIKTTLSQ